MKVTLLECTPNAMELLLFSKDTRHMAGLESYGRVKEMSFEKKKEELEYVFNTISSSWEFVDYVFLIEGVTRALTHQLVRHRVGTSFAQQTQRGVDMSEFDYLSTGDCIEDQDYHITMAEIKKGYSRMVNKGIKIQDARGVLPTNILTNILFKGNLRALSTMMEVRLCLRTQGEFQDVALAMKGRVLEVHPWADSVLLPYCLLVGRCKFPRFQKCPIKKKWVALSELEEEYFKDVKCGIRRQWEGLVGHGLQPSLREKNEKDSR